MSGHQGGFMIFLADLGGSRFVISMSRVLQNVVHVDEEKHQTPLEIFNDQGLISFTKHFHPGSSMD